MTTEMSGRQDAESAEPTTMEGGGAAGRSVVLLVAAGVLVVVVVALVLLFGIARPPALPLLSDEPDPAPSGAVAWVTYEEEGNCLHIAHPDATVERLTCDHDAGHILAWDDEGIVLPSWGSRDELRWIDPVTGDEIRREGVTDQTDFDPQHQHLIRTRREDGRLIVTLAGSDEVVWEVEAPEAYRIDGGARSPDGAWVAMFDSASRLLVVPADGSDEPRVWAEDTVTWEVPIWEGSADDVRR